MDDIFIKGDAASKRRKTKREMSPEEYELICQRMTELRERRKISAQIAKETGKPVEKKGKATIKYVDREVVREVPVDRIVEKVVEKPVEVIREVEKVIEKPVEVIREVERKGNNDLLEHEIIGLKKMIMELRMEPKQARREEPKAEPTPVKKEKFIYTGPFSGFRPL